MSARTARTDAMARHTTEEIKDLRRNESSAYWERAAGIPDLAPLDEARGAAELDWLIRMYAPAWLDLAGLGDEAQRLRELPPVVDLTTAQLAGPVALAVAEGAESAWLAVGGAAGEAWGEARVAANDVVGPKWRHRLSATPHLGEIGGYALRAALNAATLAAMIPAGEAADMPAVEAAARDALAPTAAALATELREHLS